jgi:hypothetical protein
LPPPWPPTSAPTGNRRLTPTEPDHDLRSPDTIASLAKAIAKEAQAAAPGLTEAADRALDEKTAAHEAFCRAEAAWGDARHAKAQNDRRAEAAAALARLADRPDLIDVLMGGVARPTTRSAPSCAADW